MSLTVKQFGNMSSFRGSPNHDTDWEKVDFERRDYRSLMIVVLPASTAAAELSVDGKDVLLALPKGTDPVVYTFRDVSLSRVFLRKTGAVIEGVAYSM